MSDTATEQLKKLYDSQLTSTKEQLTQAYDQNVSALDEQKEEAARLTQKNLTRTAVEAQQAQKNYAELNHAYGLSSGAMSQARLAQDNQLQADLTALRAAQQSTDDNIERQRTLLAKEYSSALAEAQASNDLARAQALYEEAKEQEEKLNQQQEAAAKLMASAGDFSLYANLYGLTPEQVAALEKAYGFTGSSGSSSGSSSSGTGNTASDTPVLDQSDPLVQALDEKTLGVLQGTVGAVIDKLYGTSSGTETGTTASTGTSSNAGTGGGSIVHTSASGTVHGGGGGKFGTPTTSTTAPTFSTISQDIQTAVNAGKSRSEISQYIHSAVSAGYITDKQGQSLLKLYLS